MLMLFFVVFGPLILGVVIGSAWWLWRRRRSMLAPGTVAWFTLAAGGAALVMYTVTVLLIGLPLLGATMPQEVWALYRDYRFMVPALIGCVALVLLALPVRSRLGAGTAELAPRGAFTFTSGSWFITPGVVLALIILTTVLAGAASQRDPQSGRYTMYLVELGGANSMGTDIYGWFYSIPAFLAAMAMILIAVVDLVLISRPAYDAEREEDARIRTIRARNVAAVTTGALMLHLGLILESLAGTASLQAQLTTGGGYATFWTPIAALIPAFHGASYAAATAGIAYWTTVAMAGIPARRSAPVPMAS